MAARGNHSQKKQPGEGYQSMSANKLMHHRPKHSRLRDAISIAIMFGVAGVASAQDTSSEQAAPQGQTEATNLDRIQVTGSRIRQVDVETAQPVTFVTRQDIEKQGFQSVGDILQNISAMGNPPISRASALSAGEAVGGTYVQLRNLGAVRTLVLLNGRRLGVTTGGLADISKIPTSAVERVEVLKDGASSIYGSDAIAGVVNIITRSGFDGASGSVYYGQYSAGDGATTTADAVYGITGERGSLTVAAEWRKEDRVWEKDREYSAFPRSHLHPTDGWTTVHAGGGFTNGTTRMVLREGGDPRNIADYRPQDIASGGCASNSLANPGPGNCAPGSVVDKTNTNLQMDLRTPLKTKSLYLDGILDLTDNVRFRTNMLYSNRVSDRSIAGYPMQGGSFNSPMAANSYFNPLGTPIRDWWRRTWEVPRTTSADSTDYRFSGVFEGSFEAASRTFDWDVGYVYNESKLQQSGYGNLNLASVRNGVGPSFMDTDGVVKCGVPGTVIAGCVPFNPFLGYGVVGQGGLTDNQALRDYLFQEEHATGKTSTEIFSANLTTSLFELPAGPLGVAAGIEHRREKGQFNPDALAVTGGSTNLAAGPTKGGYTVKEAYLEVQVPILSDIPFARELTAELATRYSRFDSFGNTTNNKFGLKWKPFDSLLLRATVADGFRAPTVGDLYGGGSDTFAQFTDPCDTFFGSAASNATTRANCTNGVGGNGALGALAANYRQLGQGNIPATQGNTATPLAFKSGSNPLLTPELSTSQTIGFVWSPNFLEGFSIGVDWWKIRISDTVVGDSASNMLNDCYVLGIASRCVTSVNGAPGFTRLMDNGGIPVVNFGTINAGFRKAEGFDVDLRYGWETDDFGKFNITSSSTYTAKDYYVSSDTPQHAVSQVGMFANTALNTFRIRSNLGLTWEKGAVGMSWNMRYYSGMKETCTYFTPTSLAAARDGTPVVTEPHLECDMIGFAPNGALQPNGEPASALRRLRKVGSNTFNDVQFRVQTPWDATVSLGANNVFDRSGPVMYSQPSSSTVYYGGFDIGRFYYMKYTQRF